MPAFLYDLTILWHYMDLLLCAWENVLKKQFIFVTCLFWMDFEEFQPQFPFIWRTATGCV